MPAGYAVLGYGRLDRYFEQIAKELPTDAANAEQFGALRNIRSVVGASTFENGKIRDVLFVRMPQVQQLPELQRTSLAMGTKDTFLYLASVLALAHPPQLQGMPGAAGLPGALQPMVAAFLRSGVTLDDWNAAFAPELGIMGDWPESSRTPALFASLPVKDAVRARAIAAALTSDSGEGTWTASERDGVQYFTSPPVNPMVPIAPTVAVANGVAVLGPDVASVEAAVKRSSLPSELQTTANYRTAEKLVPTPTQSFLYLDLPMFYTRLDAAVRPMLVMAAAFMPKIAETIELSKLPAAEVITKHLSPVVLSQSYEEDGYLTSSIGPVSAYQAVLGVAVASGAGTAFYQKQLHRAGGASGPSIISPTPLPDEQATQEPTPEPDDQTP
jgi:hypothetical protein